MNLGKEINIAQLTLLKIQLLDKPSCLAVKGFKESKKVYLSDLSNNISVFNVKIWINSSFAVNLVWVEVAQNLRDNLACPFVTTCDQRQLLLIRCNQMAICRGHVQVNQCQCCKLRNLLLCHSWWSPLKTDSIRATRGYKPNESLDTALLASNSHL